MAVCLTFTTGPAGQQVVEWTTDAPETCAEALALTPAEVDALGSAPPMMDSEDYQILAGGITLMLVIGWSVGVIGGLLLKPRG